jgi:hypothetical protein
MNRILIIFALFIRGLLCAIETDFDVAIVGSSPISLLEAVYQLDCGKRVLILEKNERCGGAWKSIDICGIADADLGCHSIGNDARISSFLRDYIGCHISCLEEPFVEGERCKKGFYFSKGCHELISCLEKIIKSHENGILLHKELQSVFFDEGRGCVYLKVENDRYTSSKLIITPASRFYVENPTFSNPVNPNVQQYPHLYLLVEDAGPVNFAYLNGITAGMSRAMNLTPFVAMPKEGMQLIAIQAHKHMDHDAEAKFFEAFKSRKLLSADAKIILSETYLYQTSTINTAALQKVGGPLLEVLQTSAFTNMSQYIDKWKMGMSLR